MKKFEEDNLKCVRCTRFATPAKLRIDGAEIRGWKCKCGEEYLHPADAEWLLLMKKSEREKLTAKVTKIGNSYSVRIPKEIVDALDLSQKVLTIKLAPREIKLLI
ncbi:AbrB/MazE/SpoVT family DNA-binding domain-containing protein [Candidatus Micrarchaeota archaeon]|nr:AbrB/MazE/SpoVT family DNA-binding domain-containing protein [Candidatus Micrarchaeota archaeon]